MTIDMAICVSVRWAVETMTVAPRMDFAMGVDISVRLSAGMATGNAICMAVQVPIGGTVCMAVCAFTGMYIGVVIHQSIRICDCIR